MAEHKFYDYKLYDYRVVWSAEDEEHIGLCIEFPSLSWLSKKQDDAFRGIVNLVKEIVAEMEQSGETPPESLSMRKFSGKLQLRMPPEKHRHLAIEAKEQGVSLNRLINAKIGV